MNYKSLYWLFLYSGLFFIPILAQQTADQKLAQQNLATGVNILFAPYILEQKSLNEQAIDATFTVGMGLDKRVVGYIKSLYWYLEFVTKLELSIKAKKPIDAIKVTINDVIASTAWQNYLKYSVTQLYDNSEIPINNVREAEKSMFKYLPDFQIAIHQDDCMGLWNMSNYIRHQIALYGIMQKRLLQQCVDWKSMNDTQVFDACTQFKNSDFYKTCKTNQFQQINGKLVLKAVPVQSPMREYVTAFTMIISLQELLQDIFSAKKLENTCKALSKTTVSPLFLPNTADDYLYLNILNSIQDTITQSSSGKKKSSQDVITSALPLANELVVVQDFWGNVGDALKAGGTKIEKGASETWDGVKKTATSAAYATRDGVVGLATGNPDLMTKASKELDDTGDGFIQTLDGMTDVAKGVIEAPVDAAALIVFGGFDPKLAKDVEDTLNTAVDIVFDTSTKFIEMALVKPAILFIDLGADAIGATLGAISVMVGAVIQQKNVGSELTKLYTDMGTRVASSILDTVSFYVNTTKDLISDTMKCIAYISSVIVDMMIDVVQGVETVIEVFSNPGESLPTAWEKASQASSTQWMEEHRRSWEAGVNVALNVAVGGVGMLVFAVPQMAQAVQQDDSVIQEKKEQHDFVGNYRTFVNEQKVIIPSIQRSMSTELDKKYDAQVGNMERSLGLYQNYLTDNYETSKDQLATSLGEYQLALLNPDPATGAVLADAGTVYGFKTNWLDLNPGQGFTLYSKARSTFSQEIAQAPDVISFNDEPPSPKFWFNQKMIQDLQKSDDSSLEVELVWQAIYVLDTFYIGLYLGGKPIDLQQLNKTHKATIDSANLAKMLVYKKENPKSKAQFGLYEHESKNPQFKNNGWYSDRLTVPPFEVGTWYHMKAKLDNQQLLFKVWAGEDKKEPSEWISVTVSKTIQRTIGFIYSGASVQFDFIKPQDAIQVIPAIRGGYSGQDETDREIQSKTSRLSLENPPFGIFKLNSIGANYVANNQCIYVTQGTKLADTTGKALDDYVLFATSRAGALSNIGTCPSQSVNAIVSLITGNAYEGTGKLIGTFSDVLNLFQNKYGKLDQQLLTNIDSKKNSYATSLTKTYKLGNFSLIPTSIDDIKNGIFIYITDTPELQNIVDKNKNQIKDYVVAAQLNEQNFPLQTGIPFSATTNGFISLVTGAAYSSNSSKSVGAGYTRIFDTFKPKLSSTLLASITGAQQAYQDYLSAEAKAEALKAEKDKSDQPQPKNPFVLKPDDVATNETSISDVKGFGDVSSMPPSQNSLSQQQKDAAGTSQTNYGFDMSGGL